MARARNIKPGFFRNEILAELDPLARLLFAGLWTIADRAGRLEDRPKRIKADVLPYDDGADIDALLDALAEKSFIARYKHGAARYIQIINFERHQNPHKNEAESVIPAVTDTVSEPAPDGVRTPPEATKTRATTDKTPKHQTSTVQAPESHSTNRADSLNPLTDSGLLEERRAHAREADAPPQPPKPRTARQLASDRQYERRLALFASYCRGIGLDPDSGDASVGRDIAFRDLKAIVNQDAPTPADFERCVRYMAAESWRETPPSILQAVKGYSGWAAKGKPDKPESKTATVTPFHSNGRKRDPNDVSASEWLDMVRKDANQ